MEAEASAREEAKEEAESSALAAEEEAPRVRTPVPPQTVSFVEEYHHRRQIPSAGTRAPARSIPRKTPAAVDMKYLPSFQALRARACEPPRRQASRVKTPARPNALEHPRNRM